MTDEEIKGYYAETQGISGEAVVRIYRKEDGSSVDAYGITDSEESSQMAMDWIDRNYPGIENHVTIV